MENSKNKKNKRNQTSRPDSDAKQSGVNGHPKIGKKDYEAELFKLAG